MSDAFNRSEYICSTLKNEIDNSTGTLALRADFAETITNIYGEFGDIISTPGSGSTSKTDTAFNNLNRKLESVKILHVFSSFAPELNHFRVDLFSKATELHVDMCPPSTIKGLFAVRQQLTSLSIVNSGITDLSKALSPVHKKYLKNLNPLILPGTRMNVPEKFLWSNLVTLKLSNCGIAKIDGALHFFPSVKYLDLSHNSISHIIHLQDCISLKHINLSHNRIRVLSNLERVLGSVTRINVSHNEIESLDGIDKIYSLERFNAAHNVLDDFSEVQHLCKLPCLEALTLSDNPLADHVEYRLKVFQEFILDGGVMMGNRAFPALDGRPLTQIENKKLRRLMFRATTDAQVETSYADEQYLNRDLSCSDDDETEQGVANSAVEAVSPASKSRFNTLLTGPAVGSPDARSEKAKSRRSLNTTNEANRTSPRGAGSGHDKSPLNKRHSVDSAGLVLGREYSAQGARTISAASPLPDKGPLNANAFHALSPLNKTRSFTGPMPGQRTNSTNSNANSFNTGRKSLSPKRGERHASVGGIADRRSVVSNQSMSRASLGGRSMSTASYASSFDPMIRPKTFKLRPCTRAKRLADVTFGEKLEYCPDLAEIERFVLEIRLQHEDDKLLAEQLQQQAQQQLLLEQRNLMLLSRRMESFSGGGPRSISTDYTEGPRTFSLSHHHQTSSPNGSEELGHGRTFSTASSFDHSALQRTQSGRETSLPVDSRGGSLSARGLLHQESFSGGLLTEQHRQTTQQQQSQRQLSVGGPASSMDDFHGRITDTTRFNVFTESQQSGGAVDAPTVSQSYSGPSSMLLAQSVSTPSALLASSAADDESVRATQRPSFSMWGSSAASQPNAISVPPSTNLAKVTSSVYDGSNSSVRIKVVNPNQQAATRVEEGGAVIEEGDEEEDEEDEEVLQFDEDMEDDSESDLIDALAAQQEGEDADFGDEYDDPDDGDFEGEDDRPVATTFAYVGDPEYRGLSVADNLELYFREQVFGADRPSGTSPYIQELSEAQIKSGAAPASNSIADISFVKEPQYPERFIAIFSERIIDVTAEARAGSGRSGEVPLADAAAGAGFMNRQRSGSSANQPHGEFVSHETRALIVLTDLNLYMVAQDSFTSNQMFGDAPVPVLIRSHPIYALSNCTIYFGFQRCVLGFIDHRRIEQKNKGSSAITFNDDVSAPVLQQYMILTRDKAHTYPIITRLPQIANAIRSNLKPTPLPNVKIDNKDAQLLEHVMKHISTMGSDHDIVHYQMAYQVWRTRPGVRVPRTVVLTQNLILLCSEELHTVDIGLKVLDSASLKDVSRIYPEDSSPLFVTIVFKPSSVFSSKRKWRLCTDSRNTVARLLEECRRACSEKGNPDV